MEPESELIERVVRAFAGSDDQQILADLADPASELRKVNEAVRLVAALPVPLSSIPGLQEIAAIEARLSPDGEGILGQLSDARHELRVFVGQQRLRAVR